METQICKTCKLWKKTNESQGECTITGGNAYEKSDPNMTQDYKITSFDDSCVEYEAKE